MRNPAEEISRPMSDSDIETLKRVASALVELEQKIKEKAGGIRVSQIDGASKANLFTVNVKEVSDSIVSILQRIKQGERVSWEEFLDIKVAVLAIIKKIDPENPIFGT